jgi:hypothetical protein
MEIKCFLGRGNHWSRPHFYQPTCLYKHGFAIGPFVVFWRKNYRTSE